MTEKNICEVGYLTRNYSEKTKPRMASKTTHCVYSLSLTSVRYHCIQIVLTKFRQLRNIIMLRNVKMYLTLSSSKMYVIAATSTVVDFRSNIWESLEMS